MLQFKKCSLNRSWMMLALVALLISLNVSCDDDITNRPEEAKYFRLIDQNLQNIEINEHSIIDLYIPFDSNIDSEKLIIKSEGQEGLINAIIEKDLIHLESIEGSKPTSNAPVVFALYNKDKEESPLYTITIKVTRDPYFNIPEIKENKLVLYELFKGHVSYDIDTNIDTSSATIDVDGKWLTALIKDGKLVINVLEAKGENEKFRKALITIKGLKDVASQEIKVTQGIKDAFIEIEGVAMSKNSFGEYVLDLEATPKEQKDIELRLSGSGFSYSVEQDEEDWITIAPVKAGINTLIVIKVADNTTTATRTHLFRIVTDDGVRVACSLKQKAPAATDVVLVDGEGNSVTQITWKANEAGRKYYWAVRNGKFGEGCKKNGDVTFKNAKVGTNEYIEVEKDKHFGFYWGSVGPQAFPKMANTTGEDIKEDIVFLSNDKEVYRLTLIHLAN